MVRWELGFGDEKPFQINEDGHVKHRRNRKFMWVKQ
jgi:hypothetical protein